MTKKTAYKKRRLGKKIKQQRRLPVLVTLRTHRKIQTNRNMRSWRRKKLGFSNEG
jgi:ribosomal protein L39E